MDRGFEYPICAPCRSGTIWTKWPRSKPRRLQIPGRAKRWRASCVTTTSSACTCSGPAIGWSGFCGCWLIADELHINTLAIRSELRRHGHATRLLRFVLAEAAAAGARHATLEVRRSNEAALKLYAGFGFEVRGTRPNYYTHPAEDALILWRDKPGFLDSNPEP